MRLKTITEMLKGGHTALDIGTDHAYVLIEGIKRGYIQKGIACDINKGPLDKAKTNIKDAGLSNQIKTVLSNGFTNIKDSYDIVIITGLGYHVIREILKQKHNPPQKYIISTHSKLTDLRLFLSENNYKITDELVVYDKTYYVIFSVIKETQKLSEEQIYLGPVLMKSKSSLPYYKHLLDYTNKIIKKAKDKASNDIIMLNHYLKKHMNESI